MTNNTNGSMKVWSIGRNMILGETSNLLQTKKWLKLFGNMNIRKWFDNQTAE